jgi:hypothetical protein
MDSKPPPGSIGVGVNAFVETPTVTRMKGVEVGIAPIGVTVSRGVDVAVRVGVRVMVCVAVAVALGMGVLFGARPGRKSKAEQACNKSMAIMIRTGFRMYGLVFEGVFSL